MSGLGAEDVNILILKSYTVLRMKNSMKFHALISSLVGVIGNFVLDTDLASSMEYGRVTLKRSNLTRLLPVISPASDTDLGPWCKNSTSGDKQFHSSNETLRPIYNYLMPNSTCGNDPGCLLPGCVQYRETTYKSGVQQWLGCSVVFPWWYGSGPAGNRTSQPCPLYDPDISTFTFRGAVYYNFMANYGHPYGVEDCHRNIMCSPSSHYFDPTQYTTLQWCQPTPPGFYSPQCNNTLLPCTSTVPMTLRYFYTHGMGISTGCGVRLTAPAVLPASQQHSTLSSVFAFSAIVSLEPLWNIPNPSGKLTILFGSFPQYYIGLLPVSEGSVRLALYHSNYTVSQSNAILLSSSFSVTPNSDHLLVVQGDSTLISFWINGSLISTAPQVPSTASIGALNMTGLPQNYTNGSLVHFGFFSAGINGDFINASTSENPYNTSDIFTAITIANISVSSSIIMTTTTTTTTTITNPAITVVPVVVTTPETMSSMSSSTAPTTAETTTSAPPSTTTATNATIITSTASPTTMTVPVVTNSASTISTSTAPGVTSATLTRTTLSPSVTVSPQQDQKDPKIISSTVGYSLTSTTGIAHNEYVEWSLTNPGSPLIWILTGCIGFGILVSLCYCTVRYKCDGSLGITERGRRAVARIGASITLPSSTE